MTAGFRATDRSLVRVSGPDAREFLQGLVSNDVRGLDVGPVYAALLSPQGKYLFDFLLIPDGEGVLLDVKADRAAALLQRLGMYRLRAKVTIGPDPRVVVVGEGAPPDGAFPDPRDPRLGWRAYPDDAERFLAGLDALDPAAHEARRVALAVPETGIELRPDDSYILEMGFERLHGVDFRKGCYVGQEVTARMKHKTELRKGLVAVRVEGEAPPGTEILAGGKPAGTLFSVAEGHGLAHLRFDRAEGELSAGTARVFRDEGRDGG